MLTKLQEQVEILVPKSGNVGDLIKALVKKAQLEDETKGGPIRVYEVHSNKIHGDASKEKSVASIGDYTTLVAERIPEDEVRAMDANDCVFMNAFHFQNEPSKSHGVPFKFRIIEVSYATLLVLVLSNFTKGEKFSETKKRLEKRTGLKGKNFEKIKFALVRRSSYSKPTYLTDGMMPEFDLKLEHIDLYKQTTKYGK